MVKLIKTPMGTVLLCGEQDINYKIINIKKFEQLINLLYENKLISLNIYNLWYNILNENDEVIYKYAKEKYNLNVSKNNSFAKMNVKNQIINDIEHEIYNFALPILLTDIKKYFHLFPPNYQFFINKILKQQDISREQLLELIETCSIDSEHALDIVKQLNKNIIE